MATYIKLCTVLHRRDTCMIKIANGCIILYNVFYVQYAPQKRLHNNHDSYYQGS